MTVSRELAADLLLCAAHTVALGISALDHKAANNSVEDKTVVEALGNKLLKVLNRDRRNLGIELKLDLRAVFHFDNNHFNLPL